MRFFTGITLFVAGALFCYPCLAVSLTLDELVGQWASQTWVMDMEKGRSPLEAASGKEPRAFTVEPVAAGWFRLNLTTFHESTWRAVRVMGGSRQEAVLEVGALETEPSPGLIWEQVPLTVEKNASGEITTLTANLWPGDGEKICYRRLSAPVQDWALRVVFGGSTAETPGQWVRRALGMQASDGQFRLNLDPSEACCDWLQVGGERIGFSWQGVELRLYRMVNDPDGCPLSCAKEPFQVVRPDRDGSSSAMQQESQPKTTQ